MKLNNRLKYVIPPVITAVLLCVIYAMKHIYPFGINTIDYYDMGQQIAAFYYHTFDFLHGEKNLFYDPYTALSVNMAMSTSGCSHLSLFNLFFLFIKRDMLIESLSIFLMLKMMLMSLFMYIFVHNRFRISYVFEVIFSVGYGFCGYVLMLYMTIQWLDVAALFPLLMLFLHKLLKEGKTCGYIVVLTLSIIASYYQSFMILIYIVFMVGVCVFFDKCASFIEKKSSVSGKVTNKYRPIYENYHLLKLLCATLISLMLSAFIVIPQIKQTLISARFNNENDGGILNTYFAIVSNSKPAYTSRWWSILILSFAFAVILCGVVKYAKDMKTWAAILSLVIILSELFVEGVNLFWHFGSYVGYPIRNGYMINFTVAFIACAFLEKMKYGNEKIDKPLTINDGNGMVIGIIVAAVLIVGFITNIYAHTIGLTLRSVFHLTSAVMAMTFIVYLMLIIYKDGKHVLLAPVLIAAEIILFGFIFIGKPAYITGYAEEPEQESEYIRISNQLDEILGINAVDAGRSQYRFSRVKNPDASLNANYGLVLRRPVLANWTHLLSPLLQRDAAKLGYTVQYTRVFDTGGTVFSDALLGIDEVICQVPQDIKLYNLKNTADVEVNHLSGQRANYFEYDCKYKLPFGVVVDNIDYDFENGGTVKVYNEIYSSISGDEEPIADYVIKDVDYTEYVGLSEQTAVICKKIDIKGTKALYYVSDQIDTDDYNTEIFVNGYSVLVPSIGECGNASYPAHFNNNALYLGTFTDESVDVSISADLLKADGSELEGNIKPSIFSIDIEKLQKLTDNYVDPISARTAGKAYYEFEMDSATPASKAGANKYLLLPLSYDEGYTATVNGNDARVAQVGGLFCAICLEDGANHVTVKFFPDGMKIGFIISVVGLICLAVFYVMCMKTVIFEKDYKWISDLYYIGFILIFIGMYVVSYLFAVINIF